MGVLVKGGRLGGKGLLFLKNDSRFQISFLKKLRATFLDFLRKRLV